MESLLLSATGLATAEGGLGLLLVLTVKATLLLLLAGGLALALRRASAAIRHLVWSLALAALLVLPPLSLLLPDWTVPLLTVQMRVSPQPERVMLVTETPAATRPEASSVALRDTRTWTPPTYPAPLVETGEENFTQTTQPVPDPEASQAAASPARWDAASWLFAIWMVGALLVLGRLLVGLLLAGWITRRAQPVTDPRWLSLLQLLSARLALRRPVLLLRGERTTMPMACGLIWPVIVLPAEADHWSPERRRVVLLHELAHVRRHDCLTQALAQLACALYWFHPGVWWVARRLRVEREGACDDQVLSAGTRASEYAGHLLDVARTFRPSGLAAAAAVAMARPSQLEGRLLAVLDPARDRRHPPRNLGILLGLLGVCMLFPLAAMQPGLRAAEFAVEEIDLSAELAALTGEAPELQEAQQPAAMQGEDGVVRVRSPGGPIYVEDAPHGADVATGGGAIHIHSARGFAHARTGGGSISLEAVDGMVEVTTGAGDVVVVMVGDASQGGRDVEITTGNGAVVLVLPPDISAEFDIEAAYTEGNAGSARIVSDWDLWQEETEEWDNEHGSPRRYVRASGRVGDGRNHIHIRTVNGGVHLQRAAPSAPLTPRAARQVTALAPPAPTPQASPAPGVAPNAPPAPAPPANTPEAPTPPATPRAPGRTRAPQPAPRAGTDCGRGCTRTISSSTSGVTASRARRAERGESTGSGFAFVTGGDTESRRRSVEVLAKSAPPRAAAAALERIAFEDREPRVQRQAVESLGGLRDEAGLEGLIRIARGHPRAEVRREAVEALGRIGCEQAVGTLGDVARRDPEASVQRLSVEQLGAIQRRSSSDYARLAQIRTQLEQISRTHASSRVRAQAAAELRTLQTPAPRREERTRRTASEQRARPITDVVFTEAIEAGIRAAGQALARQESGATALEVGIAAVEAALGSKLEDLEEVQVGPDAAARLDRAVRDALAELVGRAEPQDRASRTRS